jgi:3-oxoacyl-[acyl-carrier protein] reductase
MPGIFDQANSIARRDKMDLQMKDKVVLVTGSSRGIGLGIARSFLQEGARVVITGRNGTTLNEAHAALAEAAGEGRTHSIQGDMTVAADIKRAVDETVEKFGGIDCAVAAVGEGMVKPGWDLTAEDWQLALNLNLVGSMLFATEVIPHLTTRRGSLTFIASIAGVEDINGPLAYGAAKAGLLLAVKELGRSLATQGVRVNAVAPGSVFLSGAWQRLQKESPERIQRMLDNDVPMKRFGELEEIGDVVVFLASPRASYVTGTCLVADGGYTRSI